MACTTFPSTGLVPNVTTHVVGNVTYLYKGGAPGAPLWESITAPLTAYQITWNGEDTVGGVLDDYQGFKDELYSQVGIIDDGLPNRLGDSQIVDGIKLLEKLATLVITGDGRSAQERFDDLPEEVDTAIISTSTSLINQHNHDPAAHPELSAFITSEADRAETAADAAELSAGVYEDTAAGISATVDGQYFSVISIEDVNYVDLYKNTVGVAVFKKSYPSTLAINAITSRLSKSVFYSGERNNALDFTENGEHFLEQSDDGVTLYETKGNLYNPADAIDNYYIGVSGSSLPEAGWAHSDYIELYSDVISISSNTEKRVGFCFYDEAKIALANTNNSALNPLVLIVPENAKYLRFNVKSPIIPEPTEIMVNSGDPIAYRAFGDIFKVDKIELLDASLFNDVVVQVESPNLFDETNLVNNKYIGSTTPHSINSAVGWAYFVVPAIEGQTFTIYSPSGTLRRDGVAFFTESIPDSGNTPISGSYTSSSGQSVTVTAPPTSVSMVVNVKSSTVPIPSDLMIISGNVQVPYEKYGFSKKIPQSLIYPPVNSSTSAKNLTLTMSFLPGGKSKVSSVSGVEREFIPYPNESTLGYPVRFNLRADRINGFQIRDFTDDIAPDHIDNATVGANHGYSLGEMTANLHGKLDIDCGSIWLNNGDEYVLADIVNSNTLLLARRTANSSPPTGTFTHVSGATNTTNIVATAVVSKQWYPPHKNRSTTFLLDGVYQANKVEIAQADEVTFVEQADILARTDIIEYWISNGGMPAGYEPQGDASIAQTISYTYDIHGQLTIGRDWTTLKDIPVQDLMGLQFGRSGTELEYIVPGSLPFLYNGDTVDYSMGVPADNTLASGSNVYFTGTRLQDTGEYANRVLVMYENHVFALGFLPIGDAAVDVRRDRVPNIAMEIRGNTGKLYFRVLDKGPHTSVAGDSYGAVGYRNVMPRSSDRTSFYAVKSGTSTFVFVDWHNRRGLDRLPFNTMFPELVGRSFEVVESRNTSVPVGVISGATPIYVDAVSSSATLILKVK